MNKKFLTILVFLVAIHAGVICAGFFAPYDFAEQNRMLTFAPPTQIHFVDAQGKFHLRPFVYGLAERAGEYGVYEEVRSEIYPLRWFVSGSEYLFAGFISEHTRLFGVDAPGRLFLLGTDQFGRDQFSRLLFGGQVSLFAGLLATLLSLLIGALLGSVAGFFGRWPDAIIMRTTELFLALPWLYLLFALRAFLPLRVSPTQAFLLIIAVIGAVGWARPARLVRGVVLSAKERNFVVAARNFGASDAYLVRRHVLPQTYGVVLTQAALLIPQYILAEVTLSFLGLGVGEPAASWGNMLAGLQQYHVLTSYWWMFLPGLALIPVFAGYFLLAEEIQKWIES
jgi:peptide/nickel transport system permease protein